MPWKKVKLSGQSGYWAQFDNDNNPTDLDEKGNIRVYDNPKGQQVALAEQVKPAYITRERDDKFAAQERAKQIDEKVKNSGAWKFADAISYVPYATLLPIAAEVAPTFAPGSPFWMNPATQRMVAGTAMAKGFDTAANLGAGYNSWAEGVSDVVNKATGWNPQSSWWGQFLAENSNPGWWMNPSRIINPIGKVGNAIETGVNKAMTLYNSPITGKWTTIGNRQYRLSPAAGANYLNYESGPASTRRVTTREPLMAQQRDAIRSGLNNGRQRITTEDANKEIEKRLGRRYEDLTEDEQDMLGGYANIRAYSENGQKAGGEAYSSEWDYVNNNLNRMANQEGTLTTRILKKNRQDTGEKPYELEDLVENGRLRENTALEETLSGSRGEENFFSRGDDAATRAIKYLNVKYGQRNRESLGNVGEDNPHYRSGVIVTTGGNQYSFDSFGHALKDLYKNLKQGRRFSWLNKEQEYTRANNFGQLNRYTEDFSPEFKEALIQSNGQLPEGVTVTDVGKYLFFRKDGRILGKLKHRELQDIIDNPLPGSTQLSPNQWINRLNTEFNLNIPLARVNEGRIEWPNIYGLIYRKGGQLKKRNLTINGQ